MRTLVILLALVGCHGADIQDTADVLPPVEPLAIAIDAPQEGTFVLGDTVAITGTAGGTGATFSLDGAAFTPAAGVFSATASRATAPWTDSPLWPILGEARDAATWQRDRVTLLQGTSTPAAGLIPDALTFRMTNKLLADARPALEAQMLGVDFSSALVTGAPVADVGGTKVYVDRFDVAETGIDTLAFTVPGLAWSAHMAGVEADLRLEIPFLGTQSGTIAVERVDVSGLVVVSADPSGALVATPQGTNVQLTGLVVTGFSSSSLVDGIINALLTNTLKTQIESAMVDAVGGALGVQDSIRDLQLGGVLIHSDFTLAAHDADGFTAYASSTVATVTGPLVADRLSNPHPRPQPIGMLSPSEQEYGAALFLDDDLLSALGVGLLETGMLDQEVSGDVGGVVLDTTVLAGIITPFDQLPAGLPVTLRTHGTVAPPATPGVDPGEGARMHIGGVAVDFLIDVDQSGTPTPQLTAALDMILGVGGGDALLSLSVVDTRATVLSAKVQVDDPAEVETRVAGLVGALLPRALGGALDAAVLDGVTVLDSGPAGPDGDRVGLYLALDATLLP